MLPWKHSILMLLIVARQNNVFELTTTTIIWQKNWVQNVSKHRRFYSISWKLRIFMATLNPFAEFRFFSIKVQSKWNASERMKKWFSKMHFPVSNTRMHCYTFFRRSFTKCIQKTFLFIVTKLSSILSMVFTKIVFVSFFLFVGSVVFIETKSHVAQNRLPLW